MRYRPMVSIVTPSFNQAKFIEETLRSVELQEYRPIHQIVIDGGSTDGTLDLLKCWERRDHGPGYSFDWVSEKDRGHADALNKGFDRARGEVVGWLNSDDVYFDRQVIATSVDALQTHPEVDVVHGEVALISEHSGLQMIWCFPEFDYDRVLRGYFIPQPTVFFRRSVTDKHRLDPNLRLAIDHIYWLQIGREHKFHKIHRIQAGDRDHGARISQVSKAALAQTSYDFCAAFGGQQKPRVRAAFQDWCWRRVLRIRGLIYLLSVCMRRGSTDFAFPLWVDSPTAAIKRQMTMRINKRNEMGPRPPDAPLNAYATE